MNMRIVLPMALVLAFCSAAVAQEQNIQKPDENKPAVKSEAVNQESVKKETDKEKTVTIAKEIEGRVSGISANFIAVTFGETDQASLEMAFDLDKNVKVSHKRNLQEIGLGDTVKVDYDEIIRTTDVGKKLSRRVVKTVIFLRRAEKLRELTEPEASIKPAGSGAEEDENSLLFKGVKQE